MTKTKVFTHYADPSHGWLEVSVADLNALNLIPLAFSRFSYIKGDKLYLEEDCDASKFFAAFVQTYGHEPSIQECHTNSPSFIRKLARVA